MDLKISRIARAKQWFVLFGANKGIDVYIGDEVTWSDFHPKLGHSSFALARDVLALLNLRLEDTPFAQIPLEELESGLEPTSNALFSDFKRPLKMLVESFGRQHKKLIKLFALKRDPHNGIVLCEQYIQGK
ncbi:MAG: hypothetical protein ABIB04_00885 [Patescibacteria group bacterium]